MSSPHIQAEPGAIAETVLLPGDPLRARHMADAFLESATQVNALRNMLGYTGVHRGLRVTVMGSGMGIPSCAIYATELVREYGVRTIVRIGTCGGLGDVEPGDLLLAQSASTDSNFNRSQFGGHDLAACADFTLMRAFVDTAKQSGIGLRVASVFSTDRFYDSPPELVNHLQRHHITGVEMESAGLYGLAMREGFRALSVLTVSDHLQHGWHMSAQQRERGLSQATALALDSLLAAHGGGMSPG